MPIPIKFGTKTETLPKPKMLSEDYKLKQETDNIINNPNPAWTKQPTDLKEKITKRSTTNCILCNLKSISHSLKCRLPI
jgi:hypothetical protein